MGRINKKKRSMAIKIRQKRREKLSKLRQLYLQANSEEKKEKILTKVLKLTPRLTKEDFLSPVEKK